MIDINLVSENIMRVVGPTALGTTIRGVVLYGSLVRGDFWPQQSDIDMMVVGTGSNQPPPAVVKSLEALHTPLGVKKVEVWEICEEFLECERRRTFQERKSVQFGFHGFDTIAHYHAAAGAEMLSGFPVATTPGEILPLASDRVSHLSCDEMQRYREEASKWACEALKAAQIFFSVKQGLDATRDKNVALRRFVEAVPDFPCKEFAGKIWEMYRSGEYWPADATREAHIASCAEFVGNLATMTKCS